MLVASGVGTFETCLCEDVRSSWRTGSRGQRVKNVASGRPKEDHPSLQKAWDIRAATIPLKVGWLQPDDISPAAVFLASDAANMVTGA